MNQVLVFSPRGGLVEKVQRMAGDRGNIEELDPPLGYLAALDRLADCRVLGLGGELIGKLGPDLLAGLPEGMLLGLKSNFLLKIRFE